MSPGAAKMETVPARLTPLVGRAAELELMNQVLDDAVDANPRAVLLSADAGVGKTRLLTEVIAAATAKGMLVVAGQCIDLGDAGLPYLPFREAIGRLAVEHPELTERLRSDYASIALRLPVDRQGGGASAPDRLEQGALFDAVLGGLTAVAGDQPVLLVIEDVHWADRATRDLLGFLLARLRDERVAIVASYRSDDIDRRHPLRSAVGEWVRLPRVQHLSLPPLDRDEIAELVTSSATAPMSRKAIARIIERADGNAFFAEELTAASLSAPDPDQLPAQLADLLLVRVDRLADTARQVVRTASVAGRGVAHELLAEVADLDIAVLDVALREAVEAHILEPVAGSRYMFRHALLAEAVYDDLLPGERVRLHAAFARALAKSTHGSAAELARHARESMDLATALTASVAAGQEAMAVAAPQDAMNHLEAALELIMSRGNELIDTVDPNSLVLAAADAAYAAGHPLRSLHLVKDALERLPDDATTAARVSLLGAYATYGLANEAEAEAYSATAEALRLVPAEPVSALRARLSALHARAAMSLGRDVDAARWCQHAMTLAEELQQPDLAADAQTTLAILERRAGDPLEAANRLRLVIAQARASGDIATELRSHYTLGLLHYDQGDHAEAISTFQVGVDRARVTGRQWSAFGLESRMMIGLVHYERGEWDESLRTLRLDAQLAPPLADAQLTSVAMSVHAGRGEIAALEHLSRLRPFWRRDGVVAVQCAGAAIDLHAFAGEPYTGLAVLDDVVTELGELWQVEWFLARVRLSALAMGALGSAVAHTPESGRSALLAPATALIEAARTSAGRGLPAGRRLGVEAVAWLARAEAEWGRVRWLTDTDPPPASAQIAAWQHAIDCFDYGQVYEQARCRARLAEVMRANGMTREAGELATQAMQVARQLQARPLIAALQGLASTRPAATPAATGMDALTPRERDVLALLVDARSNREIARQLFISEKTVSVHVSNLLAKLEVRSRAEAAALARQSGPAPAGYGEGRGRG
jgi:DNA-binding NarL/FixJ family response regulator/tetratricopeptide (TPR) repeat protein